MGLSNTRLPQSSVLHTSLAAGTYTIVVTVDGDVISVTLGHTKGCSLTPASDTSFTSTWGLKAGALDRR